MLWVLTIAIQTFAIESVGALLTDFLVHITTIYIAMSLALIVALFMVNWSLVMSGLIHVSSNSRVMHGLLIVGSLVFLVVSWLMGDVLAFGVVMVTPVGVITVSTVLVRVVVVMDGLVDGV